MRWSGQDVGRCRRIWVFVSTTRGDLDEAQSQRVELGDCKARAFRHRGAQAPHKPVGAGMQEQPELVGRRSCAGGAVGGEVRLPRLNAVLGSAAPAARLRRDTRDL